MVTDKFRPGDARQPETPKQFDVSDKGQDVLKADKKDIKFTSHTIKSGETLSEICQQYGIPLKALYAVNQHTLDPQIIEKVDPNTKKSTIAYGAPTYHVGDKLNIPGSADVPNAVKYFDAWAKATVAKQRLEKPEVKAKPGQPTIKSPEKPNLQTQITDDKKTAPRAEIPAEIVQAAKLAVGQYRRDITIDKAMYAAHKEKDEDNPFSKAENNLVDAAWNAIDKSNILGDKFGSEHIDYQFKVKEARLKSLERAVDELALHPTEKNAKHVARIYEIALGKPFNPNDFVSKYAKPGHLELPELSERYRQGQEQGKAFTEGVGVVGLAGLSVIPGVGEVTGPLAIRMAGKLAAGAALGGLAGEGIHLMRTGSTKDVGHAIARGAGMGATVPFAATLGIGAEGVASTALLRAPAAAFARNEVINAAGQATVRLGVGSRMITGSFGAGVGGSAAGGAIEGGSAIAKKQDVPTVIKATVHGAVVGFGTGAGLGLAGPLVADGAAAVRSAAARSAEAPLADAAAGTTAGTTATNLESEAAAALAAQAKTASVTEIAGKGAPPVKDLPDTPPTLDQKTTPQQDLSKGASQPTDVSKGTTTTPGDLAKTTQDVPTDGSAAWQKGSTHDVPAAKKTADDSVTQGAHDKAASTTQPDSSGTSYTAKDSGSWRQGSTHDMPASQKQDVSKYASSDASKATPQGDTAKTGPDVWQKGSTHDMPPRETPAADIASDTATVSKPQYREVKTMVDGKEVIKRFKQLKNDAGEDVWSPTNARWEEELAQLRADKAVTGIKERPMNEDWTSVKYQRGGRTIEKRIKIEDGTMRMTEEGQTAGHTWRDVTLRTPDGKLVVHNDKWGKTPQGKEGWIRVSKPTPEAEAGSRWLAEEMDAAIASKGTDIRSVGMRDGWRGMKYTDQDGATVSKAFKPETGAKHSVREYQKDGVNYRDETMEVPKDNYKIWQKQKQVETTRSRIRRQDDPNLPPEYSEWETIDSTHLQNLAKEQAARAAKFKNPTE